MAEVTYFVALPFVAADDGIAAGEPTECLNPVAVVMRAEALSRKAGHVGAVAFSRTGGPAIGDFGDAKIIKKFGESWRTPCRCLRWPRREKRRSVRSSKKRSGICY